ncbi:MAG TPA: hypothetical protein VEF76_01060 [Patescibacteria group bacterium]|nr:hypothetical protein [Patescibacteria group bacterium]
MPRPILFTSLSVLVLLAAPAFAASEAAKPAGEKPAAAAPAAKPAEAPVKAPDPVRAREEAFARGKRAYDRGDWMKAIADLRPLAEYGDVRGMMLLGNMYAVGNGVSKDEREAFGLYHRAAMLGNTEGMVAIAAMYQRGIGVGLNTRLAIGWFERAARLGDQTGAFFYAIHNFQGSKGTTYDLKADHLAAYKWFRIAATNGDNKRIRNEAFKLALRLEEKLPPDQVIDAKKEVAGWAPDTLDVLGPDPEAKLAAEMKEKGIKPEDLPKDEQPPGSAPEEKAVAPAPADKPGDKPAEKPADKPDSQPAEKPAEKSDATEKP